MDIEKELNDIIIKYNIDKYYPHFKKGIKAEELLAKLVDGWRDKKIACIATYPTDVIRFKRFLNETYDVDFFICPKTSFYGKTFDEAFDCNELEKGNLDAYDGVYIISLYGESFVGHWLRLHNIQYLSIYDYFDLNNLTLEKEYNRFITDLSMEYFGIRNSEEKWQDIVYCELLNQQMKEKNTQDPILRNLYIKKVFFIALYIKNFILAQNYLEKLEKTDEDYNSFNLAWNEISALLENIKLELKNRKQRDIVMIWEDQLPYHKAKEMPYLSEMMEKGVTFEEMFTVTPYSLPTLMTIFCSQNGGTFTYKNKIINEENSEILKNLKESGYIFKEVSGYCQDCFKSKHQNDKFHNYYDPAPELLWDVWRNMLEHNEPLFILVMILAEMHNPWFSSKLDDRLIQDYYGKERAIISHKDADEQEEFYLEPLGENTVKIFMSDHGEGDFGTRFHVVTSIVGEKYKPERIKGITSLVDFYEIVAQIIEGGKLHLNKIEREFAVVQDIDYAYGRKIGETIEHKEPIPLFFFGYYGLITKNNIYMKFNNGTEWLADRNRAIVEPCVFQLPNNICDQTLLPKFRDLAKQILKLKATDDETMYSKYIQKVYDNAYQHNLNKIDKITQYLNEQLSKLDGAKAAIRGGGEHVARLISLISDENKQKIALVIDNDEKCLVGKMGYKVISSADFCPENVSLLLISSPIWLGFFREEAKEYKEKNPNLQVLDIYAWLKEEGFECRYDIFTVEPRPEDYDVNFPYEKVKSRVRKRVN